MDYSCTTPERSCHRGKPLPFWLVSTDGGLLQRAWQVKDGFLAPAQRLDVLVDLSGVAAGERVMLRSLAYDPMENDAATAGEDPMLEHPGAPMMGAAMDLMELRVGKAEPVRGKVPEQLAKLDAPSAGQATTHKRGHMDGSMATDECLGALRSGVCQRLDPERGLGRDHPAANRKHQAPVDSKHGHSTSALRRGADFLLPVDASGEMVTPSSFEEAPLEANDDAHIVEVVATDNAATPGSP